MARNTVCVCLRNNWRSLCPEHHVFHYHQATTALPRNGSYPPWDNNDYIINKRYVSAFSKHEFPEVLLCPGWSREEPNAVTRTGQTNNAATITNTVTAYVPILLIIVKQLAFICSTNRGVAALKIFIWFAVGFCC